MMMNLKIDTKEKFHEITLQAPQLTANMTGIWEETLTELQKKPPYNVIMNMGSVEELELEAGAALVQWQHQWYEQSHSFVLCHVKDAIEKVLDDAEMLEHLNITPTLSEAWDIVQMEEIERELLDGFEE